MNLIEQIKVNDVSIDGYHGTYYSNNEEYVQMTTDSDGKLIEGIKSDGSKHIAGDLIVDGSIYNDSLNIDVDEIVEDILERVDEMLESAEETLSYFDSIDNDEWLHITIDSSNKIINGIKTNGETYINKIESPTIDDINDKIPNLTPEEVELVKNLTSGNVLFQKTWYCCGDSFTDGDFSNSDTPETSWKFQEGKYRGLKKVYPRFIALRNNMYLHQLAHSGATLGLRRDDKYWGNPEFDSYTTIPCCLASANLVSSSTITQVSSKYTLADADAGFCSFMHSGANLFTFTANGWSYDEDNEIYDVSKVVTINGTSSIGDKIQLNMSKSNSAFYNQFREIEKNKTADECKTFTGYITSWFGINDSGRCILGTLTDETLDTFYGSLNWWAINCITKFPRAKIGFIVSNRCKDSFKQAVRDVAQKWGICYLDMDGDIKVPIVGGARDSVSGQTIPLDSRASSLRWNNFRVSSSNGHPNEFAHEYESTFIENWLRTL